MEERKKEMEKRDDQRVDDAIDVLLRDPGESDGTRQRLPSDFITSNLIEMMIPGEETLPTAMTLVVKFLSDSPVALARLVVRVRFINLISSFF